MKLNEVKRGMHVRVAEHQVRVSNWIGTCEHPVIETIKEYAGTVEDIYDPVSDSGGVMIIHDGTKEIREECDPQILTVA